MFRTAIGMCALVATGLVLSFSATTVAVAQESDGRDLRIAYDVVSEVNRFTHFTIFDDVSVEVNEGIVRLIGKVTMPYKRQEIQKRAERLDGVVGVVNEITVLPVSRFDDDLRQRIARSIYGHASFWNYAAMANPPIHIIVERSHVTLTGVVGSNVDRALARALASQFGAMSVTVSLRTDAEVREAELGRSGRNEID